MSAENRRVRILCCAVSSWLVVGLTAGVGVAQEVGSAAGSAPVTKTDRGGSPSPKSDGAALEEMVSTIKRLEERVRELEARVIKVGSDSSATSVVRAVQQEVTKIQEARTEEAKQNGGFLSFFQNTELTGFVDAYYGYNFNRPRGEVQLRNFDTRHNQFSFNLAEIALEKKPTPDSRLGFRMDLNFGPATEIVHSLEPGGGETFKHLQQGYASYLAPVGKGLQVDAGKFVTQHGAEVIETKDNWNYSRSLLFALAIPYYHFGVRVSYPFSDKFSLAGFAVNGWNNVVDNNHRKTFGVQAVVKPTAKVTVMQNYMVGPEQIDNDSDVRHLFDTTITYAVNPKLSLMANYDYGLDRVGSAGVHWQGIAGYARVQVNKWLAFSPRFEWFDDHDGFTTGTRQAVKDITLTSEHKIANGLLTRLEYRRDFSDKDFFIKPVDRLVGAQSGLSFGLVYSFTSKGEQ